MFDAWKMMTIMLQLLYANMSTVFDEKLYMDICVRCQGKYVYIHGLYARWMKAESVMCVVCVLSLFVCI